MYCEVCKKIIKEKITIDTIFRKKEIHLICEYCYKAYPLHFLSQLLPIDDYHMVYYLISKKHYDHHPIAYLSFMKPYIISAIKQKDHYIFFWLDVMTEEIFDTLDILKLGDLMVVSLYESIDFKKGE